MVAKSVLARMVVAVVLTLAPTQAALAQGGPWPPCAGAVPVPDYPQRGEPPTAALWVADDLPDGISGGWQPAPCTGWEARPPTLLVATAGRFTHAGSVDDLLGRFAAISGYSKIRYWSVSADGWRPLVIEAYALDGYDRYRRRADFSAAELATGRPHFIWQNERSPAGGAVYVLRVRAHGPDRLVISLRNVEKVRLGFLPLFDPGDFQFLYFVDREGPGRWTYYALTRASSKLGGGPLRAARRSFVNRAVALFRHLAGIPTDRDPPAAP